MLEDTIFVDTEIEEEFDPLASLLEQEFESREEEAEEILDNSLGYDPLKKVASVLERDEERFDRFSVDDPDLLRNILPRYIAKKENSSFVKKIISSNLGLSGKDLASILFSDRALKEYNISPNTQEITSFEDYIGLFDASFGKRLSRFLKIEMPSEEPSLRDKTKKIIGLFKKDRPGKRQTDEPMQKPRMEAIQTFAEVKEKYQEPLFTGFNHHTLIAANTALSLLKGYDERLKFVADNDELAKLIFLNTYAINLPIEKKNMIRVQLNDKSANLDDLIKQQIFAAAINMTPELTGLDVSQTIIRYEKIMSSRIGLAKDLITQLEPYKRVTMDYTKLFLDISNNIREETGVAINLGTRTSSEQKFNEALAKLLNLDLEMYTLKPREEGGGTNFKPEDIVITVKALKGDTYNHGKEVKMLPIGSIGKLDSDRDFKSFMFGGYTKLADEEMQKLEKLVLNEQQRLAVGTRIKIIKAAKGERYRYGGDIYDVPIGTEAKVIFIDINDNRVRIGLPGQHWNLALNEVESLEPKPEANPNLEQKRKDIQGKFKDISDVCMQDFNIEKDKRRRIVSEGIDTFINLGIDRRIIRTFFNMYLTDPENFEMLPENDIFNEINELSGNLDYSDLTKDIIKNVNERVGIYFSNNIPVDDFADFIRFKEALPDNVLAGYVMPENPKTDGIEKGTPVILLREYGNIPKGTIGIYNKPYNRTDDDDHYVDFGEEYGGMINIERKVAVAQSLFGDTQKYELMNIGARVKIRKDSEYAHQNECFGTLVSAFDKHDELPKGYWGLVKFDDGLEGYYFRKEDLEFVDPKEDLNEEEFKEFEKRRNGTKARKAEIRVTVDDIITHAEKKYKNIEEKIRTLSREYVDTFRSIGLEDELIRKNYVDRAHNDLSDTLNLFGE